MPLSLEDRLKRASRHVAEAEAWYARQASLLATMSAAGHDTSKVRQTLEEFEQTLNQIRADWQRLLDESKCLS